MAGEVDDGVATGSEKINFFVRKSAGDFDTVSDGCIHCASVGEEEDVDERRHACGVRGRLVTNGTSAEHLTADLDCKLLRGLGPAKEEEGVRGMVEDEPCREEPPAVGGDVLMEDPFGALNLLLVACCCCFNDDTDDTVSIDRRLSFNSDSCFVPVCLAGTSLLRSILSHTLRLGNEDKSPLTCCFDGVFHQP